MFVNVSVSLVHVLLSVQKLRINYTKFQLVEVNEESV